MQQDINFVLFGEEGGNDHQNGFCPLQVDEVGS